jgi:putative hemolysin
VETHTIVAVLVLIVSAVALAAFAAAETALERANRARIQALGAKGDPRAQQIAESAERIAKALDPLTTGRILFAASLVLSFAYLGVRAYGVGPGIVGMGGVGVVAAALVQMTVGLVAARQPEVSALQLSQFIRWSSFVFGGPSFVLSLPARFIARTIRAVAPEPDDLLALVEREEAAGGVEEEERRMIRGIIALEDKTAREIMVPRIDMAAANIDDSVDDVAAIIIDRGFSRVPIYRESIDDIVGIVYAKDLLRSVANGGRERRLSELLRDPVFIPESKRLDQLLTEMRASRTHMAIVVDEYGGTAGLVTIEDLLEEIVGDIEDEYDTARVPMEVISENEVVLDAGAATSTLRDVFGVDVESEDFDTVGGLVIHELGRLPLVGDETSVDGLTLRVLSMSGRRIRRLRVERHVPEPAESAAAK